MLETKLEKLKKVATYFLPLEISIFKFKTKFIKLIVDQRYMYSFKKDMILMLSSKFHKNSHKFMKKGRYKKQSMAKVIRL